MIPWRCNGAKKQGDTMKRIFAAALAALALTTSMPAFADSQSDAKTFEGDLSYALSVCTSANRLARMDQQLASEHSALTLRLNGTTPDYAAEDAKLMSDEKKFSACKESARAKGETIYRAFLATPRSPQLKIDAKQLFVAWLAYVGIATGEVDDYHTVESSDYGKAVATLDVDAMTP